MLYGVNDCWPLKDLIAMNLQEVSHRCLECAKLIKGE